MVPVSGNCPRCDQPIQHLDAISLNAYVSNTEKVAAVTLLCPHCKVVLGATANLEQVTAIGDTLPVNLRS